MGDTLIVKVEMSIKENVSVVIVDDLRVRRGEEGDQFIECKPLIFLIDSRHRLVGFQKEKSRIKKIKEKILVLRWSFKLFFLLFVVAHLNVFLQTALIQVPLITNLIFRTRKVVPFLGMVIFDTFSSCVTMCCFKLDEVLNYLGH